MPDTSWLRAARRPQVVDIALAALVLVAVSLQFLLPERDNDDALSWLGFVFGAATALPLVWRRRHPYVTGCAVGAATTAMTLHHTPPPDLVFGGFVVLYTVAAIGAPWPRRLMLLVWLTGAAVSMTFKERAEPFEYAFHLMSLLGAYGLGRLARIQHAYTEAVEERARRLAYESEMEAARAVARERARIARDMHDILAHAVSLMVVQAEAGPVVVRSDPSRAEAAFDAIAGAGRDAMSQLRRLLGVLKEPQSSRPPDRSPQPSLAALAQLAAQVEAVGLPVEQLQTGEPGDLDADVEVAAYRVVQEALTNTVKHAGATKATVQLDWGVDELRVTVRDDGRPGKARVQGAGQGLIGIRERAAACGGTAATGPGPDGGFWVIVTLPTSVRQAG
ncbi:sensor histidine kinase [Streptomyces sp. TRM66268-LWL]|uniref:histidine kinase n=1 Tax=Streptomyces polyasparticus TaxID=2767826 RepID=A0ABR7SET3_9ACTN|nr:histidine kinase [Streptomyces polyasparticus]MBC9714005.1 sensor histidine kinase [Streptomyces polyasparticus]